MFRRQAGFIVVAVLAILIIAGACNAAVQKLRIGDLANIQKSANYNNQWVEVTGTVQQPQVLTPDWDAPREKQFHAQYLISDGTDSITVKTLRLPPAMSEVVTVQGIWDTHSQGLPVLIQQGGMLSPFLIAALAALVVVALVLIVLLVRSGRRERTSIPGPIGDYGTPPVALPASTCPNCHRPIQPGDAFCGECGATMSDSSPEPRSDATIMVDADEPALADLTVVAGADGILNRVFSLHTTKQLIGRDRETQICLGEHDKGVSRNHACLLWEDGTFFVQDLASTSGTYVNEQRVIKQALKDDDIIKLGRTKLVFRDLRKV